jgi:hypothetical protein
MIAKNIKEICLSSILCEASTFQRHACKGLDVPDEIHFRAKVVLTVFLPNKDI